MEIDDEFLTLPHPRLTERAFVLLPLLEISPDLDLPRLGKLSQYIKHVEHQRIEKVQGCCCPSNNI
jgi:2-amino-4-hydroxy-6-hydroxymethyldihydropteridine diphosphokinase